MKQLAISILLISAFLLPACASNTHSNKSELDLAIDGYKEKNGRKAYALAKDDNGMWVSGFAHGYTTQDKADARAIEECDGVRAKNDLSAECFIYYRGNSKVNYGFETSIRTDMEYGFYETLGLTTWEPGQTHCFGLAIDEPYFGERWEPLIGLQFRNDAETKMFSLELNVEDAIEHEVILIDRRWVKDESKRPNSIIKRGLKLKEVLEFHLKVEDGVVYIKEKDGAEHEVKLDFLPASLGVLTSSASTFFGLRGGKCS